METAAKHAIGATVWHNGDPVTITSEPYEVAGGMWQDARRPDGRMMLIQTPAEQARRREQRAAERQREREGAARLARLAS